MAQTSTPCAQQVATTLFVRSRPLLIKTGKAGRLSLKAESATAQMARIKHHSGLPTLWVNRILKKGWGWATDNIKKHPAPAGVNTALARLGELEEHGSLSSSGPYWLEI